MVDMVDFDVGEGRDWEGKRGEGREKRGGGWREGGRKKKGRVLCKWKLFCHKNTISLPCQPYFKNLIKFKFFIITGKFIFLPMRHGKYMN